MKTGDTVEVNSDRLAISMQRGIVTAIIDTPRVPTLYRIRVYALHDRHGNPLIIYALRKELRKLGGLITSM